MHRRQFLKLAALSFTFANIPDAFAKQLPLPETGTVSFDNHIKDQLFKKKAFYETHEEDIFLEKNFWPTFDSSLQRLKRLQRIIGYGNFCLLNFDDAIRFAKSYSKIGKFTKEELEFLEMLFYTQVKAYGFMGEKPIDKLTEKIHQKDVKKIPYTGNYLYHGKPMELYHKIKQEIGDNVILTSGIRSLMKQFLLFLNKVDKSDKNLSMASRSLAPPGYSFHGVGDFDVGLKGFGKFNFTEKFTKTPVYKKLMEMGYIKLRYVEGNNLGVRFEPWHIEVI